ncbi:DNA-binding response regulator [Mangrovactinospora gilvigrisea]|uniref:DNA-binding response regulator n=1 Tax=Mangrovactinospora gilvigrisea TaxID=1428644 RepID=A0A1J7BGC8_9ACTN|nr:response regulator transcription factor [Mangrovactinospora gilvigrisea]OIV37731.1 DNA-binding response regulator [Mangrovactinospora gilvigrisea]
MTTLLLAEDDADIRLALGILLRGRGWELLEAGDGRTALRLLHRHRPDLMLLDIGLPGLDGWQVLERTRDLTDVPVLVLTAHGTEAERVRGLRGGADDYLTKPFSNAELVARIEALLRRAPARASWTGDGYDDGRLHLDPGTRAATWTGRPVRLSALQFRLLQVLARNRGQVVPTARLLEEVWGEPAGRGDPHKVRFAVGRLRRALQEAADGPLPEDVLAAVRGIGYRYRPDGP